MLQQTIAPARDLPDRVDVDFSLAIHNRTGKYFIGRDLLGTVGLPIGDVYYWGLSAKAPPSGFVGKVIGRLQHWHIRSHALGGPMRVFPRRRSRRPLLHLDPFTVPSTILRPGDAVLCHDLGPLTHPELFDPDVVRIYRPIYDEIARVGPHLIFVSQASMAGFRALYPDARPVSARCIYPPIRGEMVRTAPEPVADIRQPFLLTVGSIGSRKNQLRCIEAFDRSGLAQAGTSYVMCGPREPGFLEVHDAARRTAGVVLLSYVSDAELSWLYASAAGFVLVSRLEGFGMPVAEAVARDLVPLVTRGSVLHEVAGDGALLAGTDDIEDIAGQMIELTRMIRVERERRMKLLKAAVERFDIEIIRAHWRAAFRDILASAGRP